MFLDSRFPDVPRPDPFDTTQPAAGRSRRSPPVGRKVTDPGSAIRRPLVLEIIGPAGAGKTTLLRALSDRNERVHLAVHPSKIRQFPFFVANTLALLPTHVRRYRRGRWFSRREVRSMAYLRAALGVVERQASQRGTVTVLDHGPIYRLAFLRALGPDLTRSEAYARWWTRLLDRWIAVVDIVIWLDAPNAVLLERIRARDQSHTVKDHPEEEAYEFLADYREFLARVLAEYVTDRGVTLLRFDTSRESVEQIANRTLAALGIEPRGD